MDPYKVLEVSPESSIDEIKSSYYKLARQFHPDKTSETNSQKFLEISEAWNILLKREEEKEQLFRLSPMSEVVDIKDLKRKGNIYTCVCRCGDIFEVRISLQLFLLFFFSFIFLF